MTGADRHRVPFLLAAVVLLAQAPAVRPEDFSGTFSIAPPAAWVTEEREGTLAVPTRGRDDNEACILADYQENVATGELYTRIVTELRTAEGVQNGSTILAEYDPAYQTLVFHHIRVIRGAAASSRLSRDAVSLLRRETELEWSMIDGTVTASAVLQDVRPGDRIDYAYTVRGRNPAFGGLFADSFTFGWDMAVGRERVRVLSPSSRPLSYRAVGGEAGPRVSGDRGTTEYLWEFQDLAPIPLEDGTPPSHVTYPWIEITEFEDWAAVCRWALVLYPPAGLPEGLESLAAEWRGKSETPLAGLEAALDFVQREIRYVGIELGVGSYQPRPPETVFARRFGDCKDKAYLLCTILRRMGMDAYPVLVDTYSGGLVGNMLPSPHAFDHVIAAVTVDGKRLFVDPTQAYQRGPVPDRFVPDYGYGLPVAAGQDGLLRFGSHQGKAPEIEVVERFTVTAREEPALLEVETLASGGAADDFRAEFAATGTEEMAKDYLDDFAASYPRIQSDGDLEVRDDAKANVFRTVERYRIPGFWSLLDDGRGYGVEFFPEFVYDHIATPRTKVRSAPFAVEHPEKVRERIEIRLPEPWPIRREKKTFTTAAFELAMDRMAEGARVVLDYRYRSLAAEVPASGIAAYSESVMDIEEELYYSLTWRATDSPGSDGPIDVSVLAILVLSALLLSVGGFGAYRIAVRPAGNAPAAALSHGAEPGGLGGWLIPLAIGLFLIPVSSLWALGTARPLFSAGNWHDLTNPAGARYDGLWPPYLLCVIVANLAIIAAAVLLLVLFFQRRRRFPVLYAAFLVFLAASVVADALFTRALAAHAGTVGSDLPRAVALAGLCMAAWIPYLLVSKRVKNTFVR